MRKILFCLILLGLVTAHGETSVTLESSLQHFTFSSSAAQGLPYVPVLGVLGDAKTDLRTTEKALDARNLEIGDVASASSPDYYLGDTLKVPANVNWVKTYERFKSEVSEADQKAFFFNGQVDEMAVYAAMGGDRSFTWVLNDSSLRTEKFRVGNMPQGRPRRIFWTNGEYKGPSIDLTGRYVDFFGDPSLLDVTTNAAGEVTRGLYYDVNASKLYAYNDPKGRSLVGQVLMVYYDTGLKERIVHVQVVQVCAPDVKKISASVGEQLRPSGDGYDMTGLVAEPTQDSVTDPKDGKLGPYLYQHKGEHSWSPKNNAVFAIRPTEGAAARNAFATVWWKEPDEMNVLWPFVQCSYQVSWPTDPLVFVRGDVPGEEGMPMYLPSSVTASIMEYQEPERHAKDPVDGVFSTTKEGRSLLKITAEDNIWFVPVESVYRTNVRYFTLAEEPWPVGAEMTPRHGASSGLAQNCSYEVDPALPGYVHAPASARLWAAKYYADWTSAETPKSEDGALSAVFPVNAMEKSGEDVNTIEVWWMRRYRLEGLSDALVVPTLPQVYRPCWPESSDLPSIVFASQQGSANSNVWHRTGALRFAGANASLNLSPLSYFSGGAGTIMFWMRRTGSGGATDVLTLSGLSVKAGADSLHVASASEQSFGLACSNVWRHVAITLSADNEFVVCLDGVPQKQTVKASAQARGGTTEPILGGAATAPGWEFGELKVFASSFSPAQVDAERHRVLVGNELGLAAYWSFGADGMSWQTNGTYRVTERCTGKSYVATSSVEQRLPGPPAEGRVVFAADSAPSVYAQNDKDDIGFNPNEEHATVTAGNGGFVAWAARDDLNAAYGLSKPVVLVRYLEGNRQRMQALNVKMTDARWPKLAGTASVGSPFAGPHPFDVYVNPWNTNTTWQSLTSAEDGLPCVYRDRKNVLWPRAAGSVRMAPWYSLQAGFYQQKAGGALQAEGTLVAWHTNRWDWSVSWPTNGYKTMKIGCTLTKPMEGLPEVWGASSMAVVYPVSASRTGIDPDTVVLWDPTVRRVIKTDLEGEWYAAYGLSFGEAGDVSSRNGRHYLNGAPPALADRLYVEPSTGTMYLDGTRTDDGILYPNLVTAEDKKSLKQITSNGDWAKLVESLPTKPEGLNTTSVAVGPDGFTNVVTTYKSVDHYALTTLGKTNWIVLVENDGPKSMVSEGSPISMQLIRVVPEYYLARVIAVTDPNDKLSQKQTLMYAECFAGHADDFDFNWASSLPLASGRTPVPGHDFSDYRTGTGLTRFTIGEQGSTLTDLVDKFFTVRFRACEGAAARKTMGSGWSEWATPPASAEGWLKRCLNNVTPFTQRMEDLTNYRAETGVSMIRQAGAPYEGDVALNQANLTSVGLLQLYTTLLNKGEKLSLAMKQNVDAANKQLLLAAERIGELYAVLGDEAWADALNPTIGFGSNFGEVEAGITLDYGALSSKLFCFDNQVSSLLDEELALLRGRSGTDDPSTRVTPCFNRLTWNFTRGIRAGEVAYAVNYDVSGLKSTTLGYEQAREMYPQGHGDAYGHYLSALTTWYRLLRNPYFTWPVPVKDTINVGINTVNVRYENEAKFATAAANVAKTAARVVELTARAAWRDNGVAGSGAFDASETNAFGYAEFAARGGYGALCNWVVGNSLLPVDRTSVTNEAYRYESDYEDLGLERIDRGTTDELEEICTHAQSIQKTLDRMDAGFNPLGLSENAVPFDLSPIGATDGTKTHYEQVADRAQRALDNAQKVLDKAQESANRLRLIAEAESGLEEATETMENDYDAQLIAIFGRPYDDDIGPTGTYKQDYTGPDLFHYAWMDLDSYGLGSNDTVAVATFTATVVDTTSPADGLNNQNLYSDVLRSGKTVEYELSRNGLVVKPLRITGTRKANGTIQLAYADYLSAYSKLKHSAQTYEKTYAQAENTFKVIKGRLNGTNSSLSDLKSKIQAVEDETKEVNASIRSRDYSSTFAGNMSTLSSRWIWTYNTDAIVHIQAWIAAGIASVLDCVNTGTTVSYIKSVQTDSDQLAEKEKELAQYEAELNAKSTAYDLWQQAVSTTAELNAALEALLNAETDVVTAAEAISAQIEAGNQALSARTLARKRVVNNVAKLRYNDMLFRLTRNEALTRYEAAYDIAQRYTFLAAKAYGYDSGLLDATSGADFLRSIAAERSLGALQETKEKMDANWLGLKGRLGLNNPQPYATWFSLRKELFRVLPTGSGDRAWRNVLEEHYVADLSAVPAYRRLCQPYVAADVSQARKEPGFVFEFGSCIDFGKNFFGQTLAEGDHAFDSTYFATKVKAAGVWFEGYSGKTLGANPVCYLVPAGDDRMRVPGAGAGAYASWSVLDQVVPLPYAIGSTELSDSTWFPTFEGQTAGADSLARIRLFPSFRAYYGSRGTEPTDAALDSQRLVGRSVWNTKWVLIIPAGAMYADREKACDRFMSTVSDIKLGLKTYSNSGN